jgi:head-tail adaptor
LFEVPAIGELRDLATLEARTQAVNVDGSLVDSFAAVTTAWGRLRPLFGARYVAGVQTEERATHVLVIRAVTGYGTTWGFIQVAGRRYYVRSVMEQGPAREWLELMLEDMTAAP